MIDTQVFLRAAINRRSLPGRVVFDWRDSYQLVVSPAIVAEIREVLNRPRLRARFTRLTDAIVDEVIALLSAAETVAVSEVPAVSRDPKDNIFLACARASGASYIISEDQDLLVLNPYEGIAIVNVRDFQRIVEAG